MPEFVETLWGILDGVFVCVCSSVYAGLCIETCGAYWMGYVLCRLVCAGLCFILCSMLYGV